MMLLLLCVFTQTSLCLFQFIMLIDYLPNQVIYIIKLNASLHLCNSLKTYFSISIQSSPLTNNNNNNNYISPSTQCVSSCSSVPRSNSIKLCVLPFPRPPPLRCNSLFHYNYIYIYNINIYEFISQEPSPTLRIPIMARQEPFLLRWFRLHGG